MQNTAEERARFAAAIGKVAALTTKGEKPDKPTLKIYFQALRSFNVDTIEAVADEIIATEPELISVPPPGKWRQIADRLYELKPATYKDPRLPRQCGACDDTGWRAADNGRGVVPCECKTGGQPPHGNDLSLLLPAYREGRELGPGLDAELPPVDGETELQKRRREWGNQLLTCPCCKRPYRKRSGWRCCGPPNGRNYANWKTEWHDDCEGKNEHRCPLHCPHPRVAKPGGLISPENLPKKGETMHEWAIRMGFRDPNAPGPDDPPPAEGDVQEDSDVGF